MVRIGLWQTVFILMLVVLGAAYAAPNLLSKEKLATLEGKVPSWVPHRTVSLGLDLQGGSYLMMEVGIDTAIRDNAENTAAAMRGSLRDEKIGYTSLRPTPNGFSLTLRDAAQAEDARKVARKLDSEIVFTGEGSTIEAAFTEKRLKEIKDHVMEQSIEIVRRRIDESGTREPIIARQGEDRIVIQLPGVNNPEQIKNLLGKTAKLGFHIVDSNATQSGRVGIGNMQLPMQDTPTQKLVVEKRPLITGDMLVNAQPSFGQSGQPTVNFKFNALGAKRFCDASKANVGKPFAIVLDSLIISAPVIREAICGGSGEISGSFTVQETTDLALLLRAGALPAPLKLMEERTVGPTLGSDSVAAGKKACIMALVFVIIFASTVYGLFGLFASIALCVNMVLIMAVMSMLQATLTLPGIAGMVLAIGLAVDANVLVYERIKEELRAGRSIIAAIDTGYQRAKVTIIDSNLTALISALILFSFGTGPIKGFAVTTCIGVMTSYFCAIMLTRLMVLTWLNRAKPKEIAA
ncbi:MAG: protein translocase subunit SecD [Alphaproteobacteria bacterium]|nr:protein translocase subunit SecD [Alphaproteobacteria bacterium]